MILAVVLLGLSGVGFALGLGPPAGASKVEGFAVTLSAPAGTRPQVLDRAVQVVHERLGSLGVKGADVQVTGSDSVAVFLPVTVDDPPGVIRLLGAPARLEERQVRETIAPTDPGYRDITLTPTDPNTGAFLAQGDEVVTYEDSNGDHAFTEGTDVKYRLGKVEITGADVEEATAQFITSSYANVQGGWRVSFSLNREGARKFADATTRLVGQQLAIVLDGVVWSAPSVQVPITAGEGEITGSYTESEAKNLAAALNSGALPVVLTHEGTVKTTRKGSPDRLNAGTIVGIASIAALLVLGLVYAIGQRRGGTVPPPRPDDGRVETGGEPMLY